MRRHARLMLASIIAMSTASFLRSVPAGAAAGAGRITAYQHALRADAARQARMDARERPRISLGTSQVVAAPSIFGSPRNVERIARDTLKGGETNTQIEPDIAMDPNNPNDIVAVSQQGRFKTGGSADPGFSASLDGGATWTDGNLPGLTKRVGGPFDRGSDVSVVFGPD